MRLTHACMITDNVGKMKEFYKRALGVEPRSYGDDYVEFPTERGTLALFNAKSQESSAPGSALPSSNRSVVPESEVDDVDKEYQRLGRLNVEIVKPLTTQTSGYESFYFRDPERNLIDFSKVDA